MTKTNEHEYIEWTNEIDNELKNRVVYFKFLKKDGSVREINCTTKSTMIPEEKIPAGVRSYDESKIRRVFDVDKNDWRTVNKETILEWK